MRLVPQFDASSAISVDEGPALALPAEANGPI